MKGAPKLPHPNEVGMALTTSRNQLVAELAKTPMIPARLRDMFVRNLDLHTKLAMTVYDAAWITCETVNKLERDKPL